MNLHPVDLGIIAVYLAGLAMIGLLFDLGLKSMWATHISILRGVRPSDGGGLFLDGIQAPQRGELRASGPRKKPAWNPPPLIPLVFEIRTLRFARDGTWNEVRMIEEI
jgi:hypothetical protein